MKHSGMTYAPYELPLRAPLLTAHDKTDVRRGVLIALRDGDGAIGIGDAAPYPAVGTETLDELRRSLQDLPVVLSTVPLPVEVAEISDWMGQLRRSPYTRPTLCFALECAALSIIASRKGVVAETLLNPDSEAEIRVNALVGAGSLSEMLATTHRAVDSGYDSVKIKVGVYAPEQDAEALNALRVRIPKLIMRADANGSWKTSECETFCRRVGDCKLEYVEDPLAHAHPFTLKRLAQQTGVRFAVDDSARDDVWRSARIANAAYSTLILKPSIFGMQLRTGELVKNAVAAKMKIVFTSAMESSIGLAYVATAASAFGTAETAHGVGTAELFQDDVLEAPLIPKRGRMRVVDVRDLPRMLRREYRDALGLAS